MNYRAVSNRCAVNLPSLNLNLPPTYTEKVVLKLLEDLGFVVINVDLIPLARTFIGVSTYRLGANLSEAPLVFDCSSFTKYQYAQKGIWLPRLSIQQRKAGKVVENPSPGDLVFTTGYRNFYDIDPRDNVGHVGIVTADRTVIHATNGPGGVVESTLEDFVANEPRGIRKIIVPDTYTLESTKYQIETADDIRWLILKNVY